MAMETAGVALGSLSLVLQIPYTIKSLKGTLSRYKNARADVDGVSRELFSLDLCIEDIRTEFYNWPEATRTEVFHILKNCELSIQNLEEYIKPFVGGNFRQRIKYSMGDREKLDGFRKELESYKTLLSIAMNKVALSVMNQTQKSLAGNAEQSHEILVKVGNIDERTTSMVLDLTDLKLILHDLTNEMTMVKHNNAHQHRELYDQLQILIDPLRNQLLPEDQAALFEDEGIDLSPASTGLSSNSPSPWSSGRGNRPSDDSPTDKTTASGDSKKLVDRVAKLQTDIGRLEAQVKTLSAKIASQENEILQASQEKEVLIKQIQSLEQEKRPSNATMPLSPPTSPEVLTKQSSLGSSFDARSFMSPRIESPQDLHYNESHCTHYNQPNTVCALSNSAIEYAGMGSESQSTSDRRTASEPLPPLPPRPRSTSTSREPIRTRSVPEKLRKAVPLIEFMLFDERKGTRSNIPAKQFYTLRLKAWNEEKAGAWSEGNHFIPEDQLEAYMELLRHKEECERTVFTHDDYFMNIKADVNKLVRTETFYPSDLFDGRGWSFQHKDRVLSDGSTISGEGLEHGDSIWLVLRDPMIPVQDLILDDLGAVTFHTKAFRDYVWRASPEAVKFPRAS